MHLTKPLMVSGRKPARERMELVDTVPAHSLKATNSPPNLIEIMVNTIHL